MEGGGRSGSGLFSCFGELGIDACEISGSGEEEGMVARLIAWEGGDAGWGKGGVDVIA